MPADHPNIRQEQLAQIQKTQVVGGTYRMQAISLIHQKLYLSGSMAVGDDNVLFSVKDKGKRLPADFEKRRHASMDIILMETLSEQLEGRLSVKNKDGVTVVMIFKPQHTREKVPGLLILVNKTA
jgi:two-component sensor histidine kinase